MRAPQAIEDFDYPSYLANQGFSGIFWVRQVEILSEGGGNFWIGRIYDVRQWFSNSLEVWPETPILPKPSFS